MRTIVNTVIAGAALVFAGVLTLNAAVDRGPWTGDHSALQTVPRWTIPPTAAEEKNPLPVNPATLAGGKRLFDQKCQACHGPAGKGDGPDADKRYLETMDLTQAARAVRNTDGQVFYKIWNGRLNPKMPALSEELTREQVWAIVTYVQSLRQK